MPISATILDLNNNGHVPDRPACGAKANPALPAVGGFVTLPALSFRAHGEATDPQLRAFATSLGLTSSGGRDALLARLQRADTSTLIGADVLTGVAPSFDVVPAVASATLDNLKFTATQLGCEISHWSNTAGSAALTRRFGQILLLREDARRGVELPPALLPAQPAGGAAHHAINALAAG